MERGDWNGRRADRAMTRLPEKPTFGGLPPIQEEVRKEGDAKKGEENMAAFREGYGNLPDDNTD